MDEKRAYKRHKMPLHVNARFYDHGKPVNAQMGVCNLSRGGACLNNETEVEDGTIINLEIYDCDAGFASQMGTWNRVHGDQVNLTVQGQVVRNEDENHHHHIAVKFNSPVKILGYGV